MCAVSGSLGRNRASRQARVNGASALVEGAVQHGVKEIFGLPGGTCLELDDALRDRDGEVRHILGRDERNCAYKSADGYARASGRVGVCEASSGGGAVYLASGLAEAFASSIPVLALTSDIQRQSRGSGAITEIDQVVLFAAVTKWRRVVERASDFPALVSEAMRVARAGRPGPVALICPEDVLAEAADEGEYTPPAAAAGERDNPSSQDIATVARFLSSAERPAIFAGGGVHSGRAWEPLRELAERGAIPVATTIHGKGALSESHPLALGVAGANGARGYANPYLAGSDAVLIVGSRANSTDTNGYTAPARTGNTCIAQVDIDGSRAKQNFPRAIPLVGDCADILRQLFEQVSQADSDRYAVRARGIERSRSEWEQAARGGHQLEREPYLHPGAVIRALHEVFGAETFVTADAGTPTPNVAAYWTADSGARRVIIPRGHGPMGYAISAAIGTAIANPGERVLCITTEGSVAMGSADWETAARLSLPITFVVLDNASLAWIKMLQHLYLSQRYFAVDPGPLDIPLLAKASGLEAETART